MLAIPIGQVAANRKAGVHQDLAWVCGFELIFVVSQGKISCVFLAISKHMHFTGREDAGDVMVSGQGRTVQYPCAWRSRRDSEYQCKEPVAEKGQLCILHTDSNKDRCDFEKILARKMQDRPADFRGVVFPPGIRFRGELQGAVFSEAIFLGAISFDEVTFKGDTDFSSATFRSQQCPGPNCPVGGLPEADFVMARFQGNADFRYAQFDSTVGFNAVTFEGLACFSLTRFQRATFNCGFRANALFDGAGFMGSAQFRSRFDGDADFNHAKFLNHVSFNMTRFLKESSFRRTTFSVGDVQEVWPSDHHADNLAIDFKETRFSGEVYFEGNFLRGTLMFTRAQFESALFFRGPFYPAPTMSDYDENLAVNLSYLSTMKQIAPRIAFEDVLLADPNKVHFENMSLCRTTLAGTVIRTANFHNVIWPRALRGKLQPVPLEYRLEGEGFWEWTWQHVKASFSTLTAADQFAGTNSEEARRVCRDLKARLEDQRDYAEAGDFYYAEMELRRKQLRGIQRKAYTLYWLTCGYGERPLRALVVLACIWLMLSAGLIWTSFTANARVQWREIEYSSHRDFKPSYSEALGYIARALTLQQRFSYLYAFSPWAEHLTLLANTLGPLQIGLFLLAVRRPFWR